MAIPLLRGIGAITSDPAPVTPPFPAATAVDDILILITGNSADVAVPLIITNAGGGTWTPVGAATAGNGNRLTIFWSRYNGTQTPPTTNDTGDHQTGVILGYSGCVATGVPINVEAASAPTFAETVSTIPSVTTNVANCLILDVIAGELPDVDGTNVYNWTDNGLTNFLEILDFSVSVGTGGSIAVATGGRATAGVTGTTTVSHANFRVVFKKFALIGTASPPPTGYGIDTSVTPRRATLDGQTFFPMIAYDSGELSFFSDVHVDLLDLERYGFSHLLNYQFGPISKVLDQTTTLPPGMGAFATGNSVTTFPALPLPGPLTAAVSATAGNVNVGTHSYKVVFSVLAGASTPANTTVTLGALSGTGVTVTTTVGTPPFQVSDLGRTIWSGAGRSLIVGFTSPSVVTVDIIVAFSTTVLINDVDNQGRWSINGVSTAGGDTSNVANVTTSAKQNNLSNIPIGPPGTVYRKIYRTVSGDGGAHRFAFTIFNNTATTAIDNVADADLGSNVPTGTTFAIIENDPVGGVPFREHWDTRPGAGGFYLGDEMQAQEAESALGGYRVYENVVYWMGVAAVDMPHRPSFIALFPEGPLVCETSAGSGIPSQFGSVGFMEHRLSSSNPYWWAQNLPHGGNIWFGDDIYVNFRSETDPGQMGAQGGFPRFLIADRAAFSVAAATIGQFVPVLTLQLFGPFQGGRFPNNEELWCDAISSIAEGIRGLAWWQIGSNLGLRSQVEPLFTQATNTMIAITNFIKQNQAAILSTPVTAGWTNSTRSGTALAWRIGILPTIANACFRTSFGNGGRGLYQAELNALNAGVTQWSPMLDQNGNVRQRVFQKTQITYLVFAYNYHPSPPAGSVTLTAPAPIQSVTVIGEARTITPSGATWVDTFGGASSLLQGPSPPAHIYEVTLVGGSIPNAGGAALTGGAAGRVMGTLLRPGSLVGG